MLGGGAALDATLSTISAAGLRAGDRKAALRAASIRATEIAMSGAGEGKPSVTGTLESKELDEMCLFSDWYRALGKTRRRLPKPLANACRNVVRSRGAAAHRVQAGRRAQLKSEVDAFVERELA